MGVGTWVVGDDETNASLPALDGAPVPTGSAAIEYWVHDGAQRLYLQPDLSTLSASYSTVAAPYNATTGFTHVLEVPASMLGLTCLYLIRHSALGVIGSGENHVVSEAEAEGALEVRLAP